MKNLIIILSIALLSTTVQADQNSDFFKTLEINQEITALVAQYEFTTPWEIVLAGTGTNLWETLDTNKDGQISKVESSSSKQVFDSWKRLDVNQDNNLNPEEFSRVFPLNN